jgi:ribosomal-protein-alanine N-acetyltransferase
MKPGVLLERVLGSNARELASLARASRLLHRPWVVLPQQARGWSAYLERCRTGAVIGYLLRDATTGELAGVVNLNEVVRGVFQSAYLGFYVHAAHAGQGVMTVGLEQVLKEAFTVHGLHRLEANIQPRNSASLRLVRRLGFRREGFSPRYVKIGGRWRDHERWALTKEDWS